MDELAKRRVLAAADDTTTRLISRIIGRDYTVGIMGLGYVGLPLAMVAVKSGFNVIGFDIDEDRVADLNAGRCTIAHMDTKAIHTAVASRRFRATNEFEELAEPDAIMIAVPTPLNKHREPDLRYVENSARQIANVLRPGQLVILESTTWPGTTAEVIKPLLQTSGLVCGRDFFLAFSPEREDPGNTSYGTANIPKIVGADDPSSRAIAESLYKQLIVKTVPVSSTAAAEAVKLTENIFRSVNIALVNELKIIFDKMNIDVWEVIDAAQSKPFGFMPFYPGPGLGGHCIPIDPFYLTWKAREYDIATRFIELAGQINASMPYYVVDRMVEALDQRSGRGLSGARILLIGLAYKKNIDDMRESPSLKLMELLEKRGALVDYHDPFIIEIPITREYAEFSGRRSQVVNAATIAAYDAVLVSTDHDNIDWPTVVANSKIVIDTRNVCQRKGLMAPNVVKA